MRKRESILLLLIRDSIDQTTDSGEEFKDLIIEINNSLFSQGKLESALDKCKLKMQKLAKENGIAEEVFVGWFESQRDENGGGFLVQGIFDLLEFGREELETFFERFIFDAVAEEEIDVFVKVIKKWHKMGGHKELFEDLCLAIPPSFTMVK